MASVWSGGQTTVQAFIAFGFVFLSACGVREPVEPFSIGAIADCQYADIDNGGSRFFRTCPEKLETAVDYFNTQDLAFVVHLGDFIDQDWENFGVLNEITARLVHPLRHVAGNHDFDVADDKKADVPRMLGMPDRYYSFEQGNWVFAVIDGNDLSFHGWPEGSERDREGRALHARLYPQAAKWNGAMGEEQMAWLDDLMTRADKTGKRVVALSHFPIYPDFGMNLWNHKDVVALFESHASATAWLAGHEHKGMYGEKDGVHYLTLKAMVDTEITAYSVIDFYDDRIVVHGFGKQEPMELMLPPLN